MFRQPRFEVRSGAGQYGVVIPGRAPSDLPTSRHLLVHQFDICHFCGILIDQSLVHQFDNCRMGGTDYLPHRVRFYLKYVQPNRRRIERGTLSRLPNIDGILGLQFENIVLKNRLAVFERLHIDPNDVLYDNPFFQ